MEDHGSGWFSQRCFQIIFPYFPHVFVGIQSGQAEKLAAAEAATAAAQTESWSA